MQDSKITGIVVNNTFNFAGTYTPDNDFRKLVKAVYRTEPSGDSEWFTITDNGDERTIILKKDYKLESSLVFLNGKKTILDLNGHILDRGLVNPNGTFTKAEHGSVIEINNNTSIINTTLEIKDSAPDTPHKGTINSKGL
ncbi:MAG: hypothetical protein MJ246_08680 [Clostridia bacterium]|nr:hypothetical protein [Clostridia bacterium]